LYVRHIDDSLPDRLDDGAWQALHDAILTPARTAQPSLIAGAREALAAVKAAALPVGLISNAGITPGFVLREILQGYALWSYFDDAIFSDEVEMAKPNAAIFEHALDAFGLEPCDAVFVGDQPVLDVLGPQSAGLWTIQVGDLTEHGIEPDVRIHSVADLMQGLRQLELLVTAAGSASTS
jgi:putative hydrolase of the HAD superfamily